MKKKQYNKRKKKIKIDDFDDLVFHDVLEHHEDEHQEEALDDNIPITDDEDLVENALAVEIEELPKNPIEIEAEEKPKKRGKAGGEYYVDPKEFDNEIVNYYDTGKMSDNLANMVSKISHKLSFAPNFINYTYREEMVGDGVIRMMKALMAKKYNREKGTNPFSYFTRIAFNAFRNRIKKEKHIQETHEKYQNELSMMSANYNTIVKNNNIRINKERERY